MKTLPWLSYERNLEPASGILGTRHGFGMYNTLWHPLTLSGGIFWRPLAPSGKIYFHHYHLIVINARMLSGCALKHFTLQSKVLKMTYIKYYTM